MTLNLAIVKENGLGNVDGKGQLKSLGLRSECPNDLNKSNGKLVNVKHGLRLLYSQVINFFKQKILNVNGEHLLTKHACAHVHERERASGCTRVLFCTIN